MAFGARSLRGVLQALVDGARLARPGCAEVEGVSAAAADAVDVDTALRHVDSALDARALRVEEEGGRALGAALAAVVDDAVGGPRLGGVRNAGAEAAGVGAAAADVAEEGGRVGRALGVLDEGAALAVRAGDVAVVAHVAHARGGVHAAVVDRGDWAAAAPAAQEVRGVADGAGVSVGVVEAAFDRNNGAGGHALRFAGVEGVAAGAEIAEYGRGNAGVGSAVADRGEGGGQRQAFGGGSVSVEAGGVAEGAARGVVAEAAPEESPRLHASAAVVEFAVGAEATDAGAAVEPAVLDFDGFDAISHESVEVVVRVLGRLRVDAQVAVFGRPVHVAVLDGVVFASDGLAGSGVGVEAGVAILAEVLAFVGGAVGEKTGEGLAGELGSQLELLLADRAVSGVFQVPAVGGRHRGAGVDRGRAGDDELVAGGADGAGGVAHLVETVLDGGHERPRAPSAAHVVARHAVLAFGRGFVNATVDVARGDALRRAPVEHGFQRRQVPFSL